MMLKLHQKGAVITLSRTRSQHEISRRPALTARAQAALAMAAARSGGSNSPMATGSAGLPFKFPPRPPLVVRRCWAARARALGLRGHREWIEAQVRGPNAMAIYQELVDRFGFAQRYSVSASSALRRRSGAVRPLEVGRSARSTTARRATRHPNSGRYRRRAVRDDAAIAPRFARRCGSRAARYGARAGVPLLWQRELLRQI